MAIERINIGNFTVFKEADINFCNGINVIIGENGTGKTHLLKLLYAFCEEELITNGNMKSNTMADNSYEFHNLILNIFYVPTLEYLKSNYAQNEQFPFEMNINFSTTDRIYTYGFRFKRGWNDNELWDDNKNWNEWEYAEKEHETHTKKQIPAVFIPAKDMLTHSGLEKDYAQRNLPFDITLIDILNKAGVSTLKSLPDEMKEVMNEIERIIGGKILFENNQYFILKESGLKVSFGAEAEGFKKLGLIYRLIETGNITNGSVLIWDEPEANINPNNIPVVADILLALQENGVQIFIATHDYFLAKYINVRKKSRDQVLFHSLYKDSDTVKHESEKDFDLLENNIIMEQLIKLYKEEIAKVMK